MAKSKAQKSKAVRKDRKPTMTGAVKAGTHFPVGRLTRMLKQGRYAERVSRDSGAFMAAVLEYVTSEMLELGGQICVDDGKKLIMPKHLNLGLRSDEEFSKLMKSVTITQGGTKVHIHDALLKRKPVKIAEPESQAN